MNNIAANVRYFCGIRKMTMSQLAQKAGVSLSMVSMVLQGNRPPGVATIARFASALGVSPNTLVTGITPDHLDPLDREIGERQLVGEDPKAFAAMLRVVKKAKDTK